MPSHGIYAAHTYEHIEKRTGGREKKFHFAKYRSEKRNFYFFFAFPSPRRLRMNERKFLFILGSGKCVCALTNGKINDKFRLFD